MTGVGGWGGRMRRMEVDEKDMAGQLSRNRKKRRKKDE